MIDCAKRRQARARDKALQQVRSMLETSCYSCLYRQPCSQTQTLVNGQAYRVEQLQSELEEAQRVRTLKEEREASRMERKLQHVAAAYIQFIWRRRCHLQEEAAYRRCRAEQLIVDYLSYRSWRRKTIRRQASFRLQRQWRKHSNSQKLKHGLIVLGTLFGALIRVRRARKYRGAVKIQRWLREARRRRREAAARVIQRAWRASVSKAKIRYYSRAYRHLANMKLLERSARVLQRALGQRVVYRRLLRLSEFERYPSLMATPYPPMRGLEEREQEYWRCEKRELIEAVAERKRLDGEETALLSDIESLQRRLAAAKTWREEESDRLRRHASLEETRRVKDDEAKQRRLRELETSMRREIRMELERGLETARRLMLRAKKRGSAGSVAMSESASDVRVELA
ncbi:hypothetical protein BBJ28_00005213 [Nothophytophthora sp. Chile5]|nr:hypothetical protein BBJ28_00005213 [Nothophytophthora sp. Chile5]